jgi:hypothetical protein
MAIFIYFNTAANKEMAVALRRSAKWSHGGTTQARFHVAGLQQFKQAGISKPEGHMGFSSTQSPVFRILSPFPRVMFPPAGSVQFQQGACRAGCR